MRFQRQNIFDQKQLDRNRAPLHTKIKIFYHQVFLHTARQHASFSSATDKINTIELSLKINDSDLVLLPVTAKILLLDLVTGISNSFQWKIVCLHQRSFHASLCSRFRPCLRTKHQIRRTRSCALPQ